MKIRGVKCKTALSLSSLPGLDYSLNPYRGCQHSCAYCYVPNVLRIKRSNWGNFVDVKINIPNVLSNELRKKKPAYDKKRYTDNLIAKAIDDFLLGLANRMVPEKPLTKADCEIGEALVYTIDYYGLTVDHPLIILAFATGTFGYTIIEHKKALAKTKKVQERVESNV